MSEYIGDIVTGSSSDLLADSWSKSFLNRNDTRRCLLLLFLVCTLFNLEALKAHQVLAAGKYTAEFDYDVVGTLAAARYDETEVLYKSYPIVLVISTLTASVRKRLMSVVDDARKTRNGLTTLMGRDS